MEVGYCLSALFSCIDHHSPALVFKAERAGNFHCAFHEAAPNGGIINRQRGGVVLLGYHENVNRSLRVSVIEGYNIVITVDEINGYFAASYLAENTIAQNF